MQPVQESSMTKPEDMVHEDLVEFSKTSDDHKEFLEKEASKIFKVYLKTNNEAYYKMYQTLTTTRWRQHDS